MRIAMWSGPRNLSTAMMYAFAAREDCAALDEPFYAPYLALTGADHPMRDAILAAHESDPSGVADVCSGPIPDGCLHWYQKHMPHHMVDGIPLGWGDAGFVHIHLIRHPARVIASYLERRVSVTMADIGVARHVEVFERFPGPVIDSFELRQDPDRILGQLCANIGLPWTPAMLRWPAGPKPFDGVWARHWYGAVHQSTGFAGPEGALPEVPFAAQKVLIEALACYDSLRRRAL
ncbi:MAG: HAD family hydrolase [Pseudomonadota bacterium]